MGHALDFVDDASVEPIACCLDVDTAGQIRDYAKKEWGGLVRSFYKRRYALLFRMAQALLKEGQGADGWHQDRYTAAVLREVRAPLASLKDTEGLRCLSNRKP